jgi:glycine oxidase
VRDLIGGAIDLVPALAGAELLRTWSSFRPYTKDELPIIGTSGTAHLWLATGHFRNGILLSPITAEIVAALVAGERPPVDPSPYELGARL